MGAGAFYLLVPPMIQECGRVQTLLVQYFSHGTYNSNVPTSLSDFLRDNIDVKFITELFNKENLLDALKEAVPRLWSLLSDSVDLLFSVFTIFIILLYVIFILLDYESIAESWTHLVPMKYRSFVVSLLNSEYERLLWKDLRRAFPYLPKKERQRKNVSAPLNTFRSFRNRVFHNESICWNLHRVEEIHQKMITVLGWINKDVPGWLQQVDRFETVCRQIRSTMNWA